MNTYYVAGIPFDGYNALSHHGIKGQKWGIRRYQNPDGTLTEEGRRRLESYIPDESKRNSYFENRQKAFQNNKTLKRLENETHEAYKDLSNYKDTKSRSIRGFIPNRFDRQYKEKNERYEKASRAYIDTRTKITRKLENEWASKILKEIDYKDTEEAREFLLNLGWLYT